MKKEIAPENQIKWDAQLGNLKLLRLCEGLNQTDIEGFHPNTINRIENTKIYSIRSLLSICEILNIKPSELMSLID